MNIEWIDEQKELEGKTVLVRSGLNVPLTDEATIADDFRIRKALPTLEFLRGQGAKIIVIAHIGREASETLAPVAEKLNTYIPVTFKALDQMGEVPMQNGDIVLLENLRQDERELENDEGFAKELAALADMFVQDAFAVCHREHTSIVGIPKYVPSFGGLLLKQEVSFLSEALTPEHPGLFILGGAKFATKEPLIRECLETYDSIFIGGALQNEVLAARGFSVGKSVIEDGKVPEDILSNNSVVTIEDVIVEREDTSVATVSVHSIKESDTIVDIGNKTIDTLIETIGTYKTILWNGPLGWYERGYDEASVRLAHAVAESSAKTIIGGGDTIAIIQKEGLEKEFSFVSTGGGAMLTFLLEKTLPGLRALEKKTH